MLLTIPLLKSSVTSSQVNWDDYTNAQLASLLLEVQGDIQAALGWRIEATHSLETTYGTGTNRLRSRYYPICYTNHIYLVYPGTSTQQNVDVYNVNQVVTFPSLGEYLNYNPFIYQTSGYLTIFPSGTPIQIDYVYGYPMTTLTANLTAGVSSSLSVGSGLGFGNSADYFILDGANTEVVTTAPAAPASPGGPTYVAGANPVVLTAPVQYSHTSTATLAVTNLPQSVISVICRLVENRLLGKDNPLYTGVKSRITGEPMKLTESYTDVRDISAHYIQQLLPTMNRNIGIF